MKWLQNHFCETRKKRQRLNRQTERKSNSSTTFLWSAEKLLQCLNLFLLTSKLIINPNTVPPPYKWPRSYKIFFVLISAQQEIFSANRYSRLSLSRIPRDSLKHFEISVPRHIRVAEVRKIINRTTTFNKWICNLTTEVRNIYKIMWKREEKLLLRSNFSSFPQYFVTCS